MEMLCRIVLTRILFLAVVVSSVVIGCISMRPKPHPKTAHRHEDGLIYFDCTRPLMSEEEAAQPWSPLDRKAP